MRARAHVPGLTSDTAALERRLQRERLARREVEEIAERTTRALYDKQQELVLLEAVVLASNESSTVEQALRGAVEAVCAHTTWPVGHALLRDPESGDLNPSGIWHPDPENRYADFRRVTTQMTFPEGVGLPGRVLATGVAVWVTDMENDEFFLRKKLGVNGAFAFPIHAGGELTAVLEFFTPAAIVPEDALLEVMRQIGRQLGRVVERIHAQEQIAHQATHDSLTGLANRLLFRIGSRSCWSAPSGAARSPRCCSSTSTGSRRSTTRSGTRRATRSCARSPRG